MKVILFGATGMIGQGVLRECLTDPDVTGVLSIGRSTTNQKHEKMREIVHKDMLDFSAIENDLGGYDACLFCLGVSAAGMSESDYLRVTHDFTLAAANALLKKNPAMTFVYVSGAGTDTSERGRFMWARVKGKTENALLALPFKAAIMYRPGFIQPTGGVSSRTALYRFVYAVLGPLYPVLKAIFPNSLMTSDVLGRSMVKAAKSGAPKRIMEASDIIRLAGG
jgi:uncharacterized protein YbjT (DUF2867 family)